MVLNDEQFDFEALKACSLCSKQFAKTSTAHAPRPVFQGTRSARILLAGQAPGRHVHLSGKPFTDASGDRLRAWMGIDENVFYDPTRIAILPMAFCFPGYDAKGADLPPPRLCADVWRQKILAQFPNLSLIIAIGGYAQKWHLQTGQNVSEVMRQWRDYLPDVLPLPHPSWRNTAWLKKNPWFEDELIPVLREKVRGHL